MLILKDNAREDEIYDRDTEAQARTCGFITRIRESHSRKAVFSLRHVITTTTTTTTTIINSPDSVEFYKISSREIVSENG